MPRSQDPAMIFDTSKGGECTESRDKFSEGKEKEEVERAME